MTGSDESPRAEGPATSPEVRLGSPFASDPPTAASAERVSNATELESSGTKAESSGGEYRWQLGPLRYTALGAVFAAALASGFALAAAWYLPSGAIAVATLGCGLALFGLHSPRPITAALLVLVHLALFLLSLVRVVT